MVKVSKYGLGRKGKGVAKRKGVSLKWKQETDMARRRRRRYPKKKRKRLEFSLGTSGNMKFRGVRKLYGRLSRASKKLSKIS